MAKTTSTKTPAKTAAKPAKAPKAAKAKPAATGPLAKVKALYGSKDKLVDKLAGSLVHDGSDEGSIKERLATASNARLFADAMQLFGLTRYRDDAERRRVVRIACVLLPIASGTVYFLFPQPVVLVLIGAIGQALMLPFLGGAALYFHHDWPNHLARAHAPFAPIRQHVLLARAGDLRAADAALAPLVTEALLTEILAAVPDDWLTAEPTPDATRRGYVEHLRARVTGPRAFVEEALRAR